MFLETPASFMADFGSPVIYAGQGNTQGTMALFDQPDTDIMSAHVQSTGYRIEYPQSDLVGLSMDDTVLIGIGAGWSLDPTRTRMVYTGANPERAQSAQFRVIGTPNLLDDGMFLQARLEKV